MVFEGIEVIVTVDDYASANEYLEKGWILLAINAVGAGLLYTVGRKAPKLDPLAGLNMGTHARQP